MLSRVRVCLISALSIFVVWALVSSRAYGSSSAPAEADRKPAFRQRLVAIGDLHGDVDNAKRVLRMAKVIDANSDWSAGTDILVQTGDIVDRGTYAYDIYHLMQTLRGQAQGFGGQVISILGNHEMMNAIGDWRYVTQEDIKRFGSTEQRQYDLSVDGWLGREWLTNYSSTAQVSLGPHSGAPTLAFTHGSLRPSFSHILPYPSAINELGESLLRKALTPPLAAPYPPDPYSGLPRDATSEEAELYAEGGPFWWRGLAEGDEETVCRWAKQLKDKLGSRRIIGGHTPNFEKIVNRCNASIIIIDTGISSSYGGALSALEIIYTLEHISTLPDHRQDPFNQPSTVPGLKARHAYVEKEEVWALYEHRKSKIITEQHEIVL